GPADTRTSITSSDGYIVRLNSSGGYVNGYTVMAFVNDVTAGPDSSAYVAGQFMGAAVDLDPTTNVQNFTSVGSYDGFALKLGPTGTLGWINRLTGSGSNAFTTIGVTGDGSVVAAGTILNTPVAMLGSRTLDGSAASLVAARIAPDGSYLWAF